MTIFFFYLSLQFPSRENQKFVYFITFYSKSSLGNKEMFQYLHLKELFIHEATPQVFFRSEYPEGVIIYDPINSLSYNIDMRVSRVLLWSKQVHS